MESEIVQIKDEYITLGQFLKLAGVVDTGGQVKIFLSEAEILVNGEEENRRGRKLYPEDRIEIDGAQAFIISRS